MVKYRMEFIKNYIKNNYRNVGTYIIRGSHYAVFSLTGKFEQTGKYYKMLAQLF